MQRDYEVWLRRQGYSENTVIAQIYRSKRVEEYYGDFDAHFEDDKLDSVIAEFAYSLDDERKNRPNPTLVPFRGSVRANMNGYKSAVRRYQRYRRETGSAEEGEEQSSEVLQFPLPSPSLIRRSFSPAKISLVEDPVTLVDFGINGFSALESLILGSQYKSLEQAVASLTLFSHPDTVGQTFGKSVFKTIRGPRTPGEYLKENGRAVLMLDDNKSASDAFKWSNGLFGRLKDVQFNHVYTASQDVDSYTSLANICVTPAFIAKLTDTGSPTTSALLKYRVYDLYQWTPPHTEAPNKPEGYDQLDWAPTMPAIQDLKATLEVRMARRPKDRTVKSVREVGWLFGPPTLAEIHDHESQIGI